jgi:hypothetical protein
MLTALAIIIAVPVIGTVLIERAVRRSGTPFPPWLRILLVAAVLLVLAERIVWFSLGVR